VTSSKTPGYYFRKAKVRAARRGVTCGHRVTCGQTIALVMHDHRWICKDCALAAIQDHDGPGSESETADTGITSGIGSPSPAPGEGKWPMIGQPTKDSQ
jgi:hypothetical protein